MISALLGILASILPNLLFKHVYFNFSSSTAAQVLKGLYLSVILKFVALMFLLALMLQLPKIQAKILLCGFVGAELVRWGYSLFKMVRK